MNDTFSPVLVELVLDEHAIARHAGAFGNSGENVRLRRRQELARDRAQAP